jgi:thioesterase domain-containing protein
MDDPSIVDLQQTLQREMPICGPMGIQASAWRDGLLTMSMPLRPNRNHQDSAFAGSLNALCTIVGWGTVYLLVRERGLHGNVVIRRSAIRYLRPVRRELIEARGLQIPPHQLAFFAELLGSKGRSKLDCAVQIADADGPAVSFQGSYVVDLDSAWDAAPGIGAF